MGAPVRKDNITIAVLPFNVINRNERLRTLIHGITEDLVTNLSKFVGLAVISQLSMEQIPDTANYEEIEKLGADYLVSGSVRNIMDTLRITIQLVKVEDKSIVYSEQLDKTVGEIFDAQDIIIQQLVSVLQKEINYDLLSYSYKKETVDLAAYENCLMGMEALKKGTIESDGKARKYFEAALAVDPNYALAYTGLSLSYFNEWSCQLWDRWDISKNGAHENALKAIEIDKNDYRALAVLGRTYAYSGEYEKAEHCVRKSLRMNPNDTDNLIQVAIVLMYLGYPEESLTLYNKAIELDPFHNENLYFAYGSNFYFEIGEYEKACELVKKTDYSQTWTDFAAYAAATYYHLGDYDNMWEEWDKYLEIYRANILKETPTDIEDFQTSALEWQINVNPYVGKTNLSPFWDYVRKHKNIAPKRRQNERRASATQFVFRENVWDIRFKDKNILLKDAKGLHDIHKMIASAGTKFHCMELMGATVEDGGNVAAMDPKAKAEYSKRIQELQTEIAQAEDMNDLGRLEKLRHEHDAIVDHLSSSFGLKGKTREIGSTAEKARSAITWRIRSALKKIEITHPELFHHLSSSINTGTFCSYNPEISMDWHL